MNEDEILNKIDEFHEERISKILLGETPGTFLEGGKILLMIIPFGAFSLSKDINLSRFKGEYRIIEPLLYHTGEQMFDFDGLLHFMARNDGKWLSYVRVYPNSIIESVEGGSLRSDQDEIPYIEIEREIMFKTERYLNFLKDLGIEFPVVIFLDFLGVKDLKIVYHRKDAHFDNIHPIDRENLNLPRLIINEPVDTKKIFKSSFDRIWMACGYPRCYDYNEAGEFIAE